MKSIIQIYNNQPKNSSDFFYRVSQRSKEFVKHYKIKWVNIINLHEDKYEICKDADLLIINFVADIDLIPILEYRKSKNLPTIYEINDNFLAFQKSNPMSSYYNKLEIQGQIYDYIRQCDGIQLSSNLLFNELNLEKYTENKKIITLKNCIDKIYDFKESDEFIIGWGGSSGHFEDIKSIAPILIKISKKYNIKIAIKSDEKIKNLFRELGDNLIYEPFSNMEDYHKFLSTLTIGICTIQKDRFNKTRSDVKYLEYISHGVVPVCSDFGPYSDLDLCIKFNDDLEEKLSNLIKNKDIISEFNSNVKNYMIGRKTEKAVIENRNFYCNFIEIENGIGEYVEYSVSTVYPKLYDMLEKREDIPIIDYKNPIFYYFKYFDNIDKIRYAIDNVDRESLILKKRFIELLLKDKLISESIKYLEIYMKEYKNVIDFIVLRLILAIEREEINIINGLKHKLKRISPFLFKQYFGG